MRVSRLLQGIFLGHIFFLSTQCMVDCSSCYFEITLKSPKLKNLLVDLSLNTKQMIQACRERIDHLEHEYRAYRESETTVKDKSREVLDHMFYIKTMFWDDSFLDPEEVEHNMITDEWVDLRPLMAGIDRLNEFNEAFSRLQALSKSNRVLEDTNGKRTLTKFVRSEKMLLQCLKEFELLEGFKKNTHAESAEVLKESATKPKVKTRSTKRNVKCGKDLYSVKSRSEYLFNSTDACVKKVRRKDLKNSLLKFVL